MKQLICLLIIISFLPLAGCATILKEKTTNVKIDSEPQGAIIYHNVGYAELERIGITPATLPLDNRHNIKLVFKKDGYEDSRCMIRAGVAPGWQLASFCCAVVPGVLDVILKNARNLDKKEVKVNLVLAQPNSALPTEFIGSRADELLKYKKLLDASAITKDEYEQKKKQLLGP
jgi:hypothetical protein